jgi:large subunit ribosomal protein L21
MEKTQKYAVIKVTGKQYKVSEGEEILVDKITSEKPEIAVLLISDEGKVAVGKPIVAKAEVKIKVLKDVEKGKKLDVYKYKSKSRYRKHVGFRPLYTRLLIEKISL